MVAEETAHWQLASLLRVQPELQQICRFGAQWTSPHGPDENGSAPFHIVTKGACRLVVGSASFRLEAGDVAIVPHGGAHTIQALSQTGQAAAQPMHIAPRCSDAIVAKSNTDAEPETGLICGRLHFELAHDNLVLAMLPDIVVFAAEDGGDARNFRMLVDMIRAELDHDRPGAALVAGSLANAMLTFVLRAQLERAHGEKGISALLRGKQTARAVAAMLKTPGRAWTLDELAEHAGASRATTVRLFQRATGLSPLAFLADLRLTLARNRLRATNIPIAVIAQEVGYGSETAFSRAYRRRFAGTPAQDRKYTR